MSWCFVSITKYWFTIHNIYDDILHVWSLVINYYFYIIFILYNVLMYIWVYILNYKFQGKPITVSEL